MACKKTSSSVASKASKLLKDGGTSKPNFLYYSYLYSSSSSTTFK